MKIKTILLIVVSLIAILGISLIVYLKFFSQTNKNKIEFSQPQTFEFQKNANSEITIPLSILPTNYSSLISKYNITLSHEQLIKLLRYGMVVLPSSLNYSNTDPYIYINDEMLTVYLNSQLSNSENEIIKEKIKPQLLLQLKKIEALSLLNGNTSLLNNIKGINSNTDYSQIISQLNGLSDTDKSFVVNNFASQTLNNINTFNLLFDFPTILEMHNENQNLSSDIISNLTQDKNDNDYGYKISLGVENFISDNAYSIGSQTKYDISGINTNNQLLTQYLNLTNYLILQLKNVDIESDTLSNLSKTLNDKNLNEIVNGISTIQIDKSKYGNFTLLSTENINGTNELTISPLIMPATCNGSICTVNPEYDEQIINNNFNIEYDVKPTKQAAGTIRIPVIMYHLIDQVPANASATDKSMYLTPEQFEEHIAYLTEKNYKTITTQQYLNILNSGVNPAQKTIMLTFDDSTKGQYANAFPILEKYQQVGVFFVISEKSAITNAQLKEMANAGMDIESHTVTHPDLTKITDMNELKHQIFTSKSELQYTTGKQVDAIAYPGCVWNIQTLNFVIKAGYSLGFSCGNTIDSYPKDRLVLSRIHAFTQLSILKKILAGKKID